MAYNDFRHISKWYMKWRGIRMIDNFSKRRPAYTNNEIVNMLNSKLTEEKLDIKTLAERYEVDEPVIRFMTDKSCEYNYEMLKIASNFLQIKYEDLVAIIEDDNNCSLRADNVESANELEDILNYLFNEMINQERLAVG
jgi:hypothetical protein